MKTLLQQRDHQLALAREELRQATLARLQAAVSDLLPDEEVWVFGSILREGAFKENSDIDLALTREPAGISAYALQATLADRLERPVDIVLLPESRFADAICREGLQWTPSS